MKLRKGNRFLYKGYEWEIANICGDYYICFNAYVFERPFAVAFIDFYILTRKVIVI